MVFLILQIAASVWLSSQSEFEVSGLGPSTEPAGVVAQGEDEVVGGVEAGDEVGDEVGELVHPDPEVDALLDALEDGDAGMELMRGDVLYSRYDAVLDDRQFRWGVLRYASLPRGEDVSAGELRVFRADFDKFFDGFSVREETQSWVFDGRWLIEQDFTDKRFRKVEVARGGEGGSGFDPMKLGEGPFAIPVGQEKSEILARFHVAQRPVWEGLEPPEDGVAQDWDKNFRANVMGAEEAVQLVLTPRHAAVSEHDLIRLWYVRSSVEVVGGEVGGVGADGGRWVPTLVRTLQLDGDGAVLDEATVQLTRIVVNDPRDIVAVSIDEPHEAEGWRVTVDRLPEGGE